MSKHIDWSALGGGLLQGAGAYFGAQYGQAQPGQTQALDPQSAAWTQLLGLSKIAGFEDTLDAGNAGMLQGYGQSKALTDLLPGVAQQGMKAQLGQIAGAEQGAIQHVLNAQQAQMGQVGQQGASSGFYGNSAQAGVQGQVQANTSQSIADIMAGSGATKAGIIAQGTAATMSGIIGAAQGSQAMGEAFAKASGAKYNLMKDKLNTILATGNSWGIGVEDQKALLVQAGGLTAAGMAYGDGKVAPGQSGGPAYFSEFSKSWVNYAADGGWLDGIWD